MTRIITLVARNREEKPFATALWVEEKSAVGPGFFKGLEPVPPESLAIHHYLRVELVGWSAADSESEHDGEFVVVRVPDEALLRRVPWTMVVEEDVREAGQRFLDEHTIKKLWHS